MTRPAVKRLLVPLVLLLPLLLAPDASAQLPPPVTVEVAALPVIGGFNETVTALVTTSVSCAILGPDVPPRVQVSHGLRGELPFGIMLTLDPPHQTVDPATCVEGRATLETTLVAQASMWTQPGTLGSVEVEAYARGPSAETSGEARSAAVPIRVAPRVDVELGVWDPRIDRLPEESYWLGYGGDDPATLVLEALNRGNMPVNVVFLDARTVPPMRVDLPASPLVVPAGHLPSDIPPVGHASAQVGFVAPAVDVDAAGPERYRLVLEYAVPEGSDAGSTRRELAVDLLVGPLAPLPRETEARARELPWPGALALLAFVAVSFARRRTRG